MSASRLFNPDRLLAFSDGVIAIVITLLVLGIEVPSAQDVPEKELPQFLVGSLHSILSYVLSFLVIGTFWLQHYVIFHYVERVDRAYVLLNGLFLLFLSFVPFPTGLLPVYRYDELAVVLYGISNLACGLGLLALWVYAARNYRLIAADTSQAIISSMTRRIALTPVICVVAIGVSLFDVLLGKLVFLIIPLSYCSHRLVDE